MSVLGTRHCFHFLEAYSKRSPQGHWVTVPGLLECDPYSALTTFAVSSSSFPEDSASSGFFCEEALVEKPRAIPLLNTRRKWLCAGTASLALGGHSKNVRHPLLLPALSQWTHQRCLWVWKPEAQGKGRRVAPVKEMRTSAPEKPGLPPPLHRGFQAL